MELPKNITQIGEAGRDCKIYMEDYVVSYMKQLNPSAQDKAIAVALYGRRESENGISYHFLYGACRMDCMQREVRHLSQAQQMEIEKLRKKYFPEMQFMGYRILTGEMIEGLHLCEQGICRYIGGYARFYEKNDAMLAYMLDVREEAQPEQIDQTKYDEVKKRQEERRSTNGYAKETVREQRAEKEDTRDGQEYHGELRYFRQPSSGRLKKMQMTAVGAFALLCLLGIGTFRENELADTKQGTNESVATMGNMEPTAQQKDTLLMEDKLEQALLAENQTVESAMEAVAENAVSESTPENSTTEASAIEGPSADESNAGKSNADEPSANESSANEPSAEKSNAEEPIAEESMEATQTSQKPLEAVAYIIQPEDTLIGICMRQYGNDVRVREICSMNDISNPDDIKEGQVIMLPQ